MVTQHRPVESLLVRVRELGIPTELARTIQERAHHYARNMGLAPEAAESRFFSAAVAAREGKGGADLLTAEALLRVLKPDSGAATPVGKIDKPKAPRP